MNVTWKEAIAWVAGLVEGEGCFYLSTPRPNRHPRFEMAMCDEDTIRHAFNIIKLGNVSGPHKTKGKDQWTWSMSYTPDVVGFMYLMYPWMRERRKQKIEELISLWKTTPILKKKGRHGKK